MLVNDAKTCCNYNVFVAIPQQLLRSHLRNPFLMTLSRMEQRLESADDAIAQMPTTLARELRAALVE